MASFRSVGAVQDQTAVQTIEISAAAGIQDGDLLIICGFADDNQSLTLNEGGWTEETEVQDAAGGDKVIAVYTRIASSESGTYTLDVGGGAGVRMIGFMVAYQDVDQTTPMDAAVTTNSGTTNSDTHDPSAITTVTDNAIVCSYVGAVQTTAGDRTPPSGYTERVDSGATDWVGFAEIDVATAGVEDPGTWSGLTSGADSASITLAIRPAAGGGGGVAPLAVHHLRQMDG